MLLQHSIEHVSTVCTCNPLFCNWSVRFIREWVSGQYSHTITNCTIDWKKGVIIFSDTNIAEHSYTMQHHRIRNFRNTEGTLIY